jgi:hypothetical protein
MLYCDCPQWEGESVSLTYSWAVVDKVEVEVGHFLT